MMPITLKLRETTIHGMNFAQPQRHVDSLRARHGPSSPLGVGHQTKKEVEYRAKPTHWEHPNSEEFSIQNDLLVPLTLSVIPYRSEEVTTWEVRGKDWCEIVKIRTIGHESAFPTGAFPAAFGADRRCVSCPDNLEAYFTEAAFAVDIARALHAVKQHAAKETPTLNATTAP